VRLRERAAARACGCASVWLPERAAARDVLVSPLGASSMSCLGATQARRL
jgi:hypothetical protein